MRTRNLGRLFCHGVALTGAPLVHRGKTSMMEQPYYYARPFIIRYWSGRGLAIGWWHKHEKLDVSRHLAGALVLGELDETLPTYFITGEDQFYGASPEREP